MKAQMTRSRRKRAIDGNGKIIHLSNEDYELEKNVATGAGIFVSVVAVLAGIAIIAV